MVGKRVGISVDMLGVGPCSIDWGQGSISRGISIRVLQQRGLKVVSLLVL